MEKYGVEQNVEASDGANAPGRRSVSASENNKHAALARECRACGAVLRSRDTTGVLLCPNCGTRPYEE